MKRVYLYPMSKADRLELEHPYIANLSKVLSSHFNVVNYGKKTKLGLLDLFFYLRRVDIIYFNWVEDFANVKYGLLRFLIVLIIVCMLKLLKIKIIWTHHNIHSHGGKTFYNSKLTQLLIRFSTYIIIHSYESKNYIKSQYWKKMRYFFHPITDLSKTNLSPQKKEWDVLIWGSIRKSKGVEEFLKYVSKEESAKSLKIKIIGRITDALLKKNIMAYRSLNVEIEDRYIDDRELPLLHSKSKFVFFSYTGTSVLISGVVVKSLPLDANVLAPNKGSFVDLRKERVIYTYDTFKEALDIILNSNKYEYLNRLTIKAFCEKYSWGHFGEFLFNTLK